MNNLGHLLSEGSEGVEQDISRASDDVAVFVSHAGAQKQAVACPLQELLETAGCNN